MDFIYALFFKHPRLTGGLLFFAGMCVSVYLLVAYGQGNPILSRDILTAPVLLTLGLGVIIEPRLLTVWKPDGQLLGFKYKAIGLALGVGASAIGFYLRLVVFKAWN